MDLLHYLIVPRVPSVTLPLPLSQPANEDQHVCDLLLKDLESQLVFQQKALAAQVSASAAPTCSHDGAAEGDEAPSAIVAAVRHESRQSKPSQRPDMICAYYRTFGECRRDPSSPTYNGTTKLCPYLHAPSSSMSPKRQKHLQNSGKPDRHQSRSCSIPSATQAWQPSQIQESQATAGAHKKRNKSKKDREKLKRQLAKKARNDGDQTRVETVTEPSSEVVPDVLREERSIVKAPMAASATKVSSGTYVQQSELSLSDTQTCFFWYGGNITCAKNEH